MGAHVGTTWSPLQGAIQIQGHDLSLWNPFPRYLFGDMPTAMGEPWTLCIVQYIVSHSHISFLNKHSTVPIEDVPAFKESADKKYETLL